MFVSIEEDRMIESGLDQGSTASLAPAAGPRSGGGRHAGWRTTTRERVFYYLGDVGRMNGGNIVTVLGALFLLFQGVDVQVAAGLTLMVKVVDAVNDILFGFVVDRWRIQEWPVFRRFAGPGRYLPWYRSLFWLFPITVVLLFAMPSGLGDAEKLIWYFVLMVLFDFSYTFIEVPMNSLIMTLTDNPIERNTILRNRAIIFLFLTIVVSMLWQFLISENVGLPLTGVAIVSMIILFLLMLPLAFGVKEHNPGLKNVDESAVRRYTFGEMLRVVRANKYMAIYLVSGAISLMLATGSAVTMFAAFYLFGNSFILNLPSLIVLLPALALQLASVRIAKRFGKRGPIVATGLVMAATSFALFFIPTSQTVLIVAILCVAGLPATILGTLRSFIAPDAIEYSRYKTGQDCSGIFFALDSFVAKAFGGVGAALALFALGLFQWTPVDAAGFGDLLAQNVPQSDLALTGLWVLFTIVPACGILLSALAMLFYDLKDSDAELMAHCNAGTITREECEAQLSRAY
jgi:Na+/melibiose symporter-like transporter